MSRSFVTLSTIVWLFISSVSQAQHYLPPIAFPNLGDRGHGNTSAGYQAFFSNTTGFNNTAVGFQALYSNTEGYVNTAMGAFALVSNTTGQFNTATGMSSLQATTAGIANTATGFAALVTNTTGNFNVATGFQTLTSNSTGGSNLADGVQALYHNTTGSNNIGIGTNAGYNLTEGSNNIDIGSSGMRFDANTIRIGTSELHQTTFIAGIRGATTAHSDAIPVVIDSAGQLGTLSSSQRFKTAIKPMDEASEAVLSLKPVTFHYKQDAEGAQQFGLIAEQVAKVNPTLVTRDASGEIYSVRHDAVNAMLLNEFLKEHHKVMEQEARLTKQEARIAEQQKQIDTLLELSREMPHKP